MSRAQSEEQARWLESLRAARRERDRALAAAKGGSSVPAAVTRKMRASAPLPRPGAAAGEERAPASATAPAAARRPSSAPPAAAVPPGVFYGGRQAPSAAALRRLAAAVGVELVGAQQQQQQQQQQQRAGRSATDAPRRRRAAPKGKAAGASRAAGPAWRAFRRQADAFAHEDGLNSAAGGRWEERAHTFSKELQLPSGGSTREFIVARSFSAFWRAYVALPPAERHFYEIIREARPCHLYFDLEYRRRAPDVEGCGEEAAAVEQESRRLETDARVDALLELVEVALRETYGLELDRRRVMELDSSTDTKMSRHLHVRLPGAAFRHAAHAGAFVRKLVARAESLQADDDDRSAARRSRAALLWAPPLGAGSERQLVVDLGVYTRNRAFRLLGSCKIGKTARLSNTGRFGSRGSASNGKASGNAMADFFGTLITAVPPSSRMLEAEGAALHAGDLGAAAPTLTGLGGGRSRAKGGGGSGHARAAGSAIPFQGLQAHILECADRRAQIAATHLPGGRSARHECRSWVYFADKGLLVLSVANQGFCGHVERCHRSNGVFYVADLGRECFYQKCYDPDCKGYKSNEFPIPAELMEGEIATARSAMPVDSLAIETAVEAAVAAEVAAGGEAGVQEGGDEALVTSQSGEVADDNAHDAAFWEEAARQADLVEAHADELLAIGECA